MATIDEINLRQQELDAEAERVKKDDPRFAGTPFGHYFVDDKEYKKAKKEADEYRATYGSMVEGTNKLDTAISLAEEQGLVDRLLVNEGNLPSIYEQDAIQDMRQLYENATDTTLLRDSAIRNLQAQEASQYADLATRLSASGVKGGAAAASQVDLASMNLRNRAAMEQDIIVNNQAALERRIGYETGLAQSDQQTQLAEQALRQQALLGATGYNLLESSAGRQEYLNSLISTGGGK